MENQGNDYTLPVAKATVLPDSTSAIAFFICATRNYKMNQAKQHKNEYTSREYKLKWEKGGEEEEEGTKRWRRKTPYHDQCKMK